jgi:hypothetical protein
MQHPRQLNQRAAQRAADAYFAEFGRLMHSYTRIEIAVHMLFRHCLGIGDAGRVLSGGEPMRKVMTMTRRIAQARNIDDAVISDIDAIFQHINAISVLRDSLVHRGAEIYGDLVLSTNVKTAKFLEEAQLLRINVEDIKAATEDCGVAEIRIGAIITPTDPTFQTAEMQDLLKRAWLFKPLQQETPYRRPRTSDQSQGHPPPSSSA